MASNLRRSRKEMKSNSLTTKVELNTGALALMAVAAFVAPFFGRQSYNGQQDKAPKKQYPA